MKDKYKLNIIFGKLPKHNDLDEFLIEYELGTIEDFNVNNCSEFEEIWYSTYSEIARYDFLVSEINHSEKTVTFIASYDVEKLKRDLKKKNKKNPNTKDLIRMLNSNGEVIFIEDMCYETIRGNTEVIAHTTNLESAKITRTPIRKNNKGFYIRLTTGIYKPESSNEEKKIVQKLNDKKIYDYVRSR